LNPSLLKIGTNRAAISGGCAAKVVTRDLDASDFSMATHASLHEAEFSERILTGSIAACFLIPQTGEDILSRLR